MGEEFYTVIKLITGEEIFALVTIDESEEGDPIILMQTPVIMQIKTNHIGQYVKIRPWLTIPTDDLFILKYDKVVTMSEVTDEQTIEFYNRYINNDDVDIELDGKVKVTDKMGYITTVDHARKHLENLYNLPTNPTKES